MESTTTYASKIQFRNAAKKVHVIINNEDDYSRLALSIRADYDLNNKWVSRYDRINHGVKPVGFEFYGLELRHAQRLHAAGFELHMVQVPDVGGTTRTAYIYRLPLTK